MSERTRIGNSAFGVPGIFVSQPGDDVSFPTKALMLDSRYDAFELHTRGRVSVPVIGTNAGIVSYQVTIDYPSLGYIPQITWGAVINDGQTIYYPPGPIDLANGNIYNSQDIVAWLTPSQFTYAITIPIPSRSIDLFYVIYRNPQQSATLTPSGTERVFIGNDGGSFKMRVSKAGYQARSASRDQCLIHEDKRPLVPVLTGLVSLAPNQTIDISLGRSFDFPPRVVARTADGRSYGCRLSLSSGLLRFRTGAAAATIRYAIYYPE